MGGRFEEREYSVRTARGVLRGYLDDRPGPLGVFLHGFRSNADGTKATALAAHARARGRAWLRIDLSGHGRSDGEFAAFRLSHLLDDVLCVLAAFPQRPVVLVGSSMGAWLSVLAAERCAAVRALVLLAPGFNFIQEHFGALPADQCAHWERVGRLRFDDPYEGGAYELDHAILADAAPFDVLNRPVRLSCPVVILHGNADEQVPLSVSRRFLATLNAPEARLQVVPGGDHRLTRAVPQITAEVDRLWPRVDTPGGTTPA